MKGFIASVLMLFTTGAQALDVELNLRDAEYSQASGLRTVYLRSIMGSQRPDIDPRKYTVESVQLTIKSLNGGGTGLLRIGGSPSASKRIPGRAANWAASGENTFYKVSFTSPLSTRAAAEATWTVDLRNTTAKARRAILTLRPRTVVSAPAPRPSPTPAPAPNPAFGGEEQGRIVSDINGFSECAEEGGNCYFNGTKKVRFGIAGRYVEKTFNTTARCDFETFQIDPVPEARKSCYVMNDSVAPAFGGASPMPQPAPMPAPAPAPAKQCFMDIQPVEECRQEFVYQAFPGISYWQTSCSRIYREVEVCPR